MYDDRNGSGCFTVRRLEPSPGKSASKKVAAKLFILQRSVGPLSSVPVWAEPSQLLIGMWPHAFSQRDQELIDEPRKRIGQGSGFS